MRFEFPFLAWDAWMALQQLSRVPLEHNQDGSIPARWLRALESRLVPLPRWIGIDTSALHRAGLALLVLQDLGLVRPRKGPSPNVRDQGVSDRGRELLATGRTSFFLEVSDFSRLDSLLPERDFLSPVVENGLRSACWRMGRDFAEFEGLGRRLSQRVLEVVPPRGSARAADMEAAFAPSNPHVPVARQPWMDRIKVEFPAEDLFDHLDEPTAKTLMFETLAFPFFLGWVARGVTLEGHVTWGLTAAGRNWLGVPPDRFPAPHAHIKVTPAFEVYFGRVDPTALAEISLYSAPTGEDHGIASKLEREAVRKAVGVGISSREILRSLDHLLAHPLPPNVRTALEDWARTPG
jgi:hypothetical protein